MKHGVSKPPKWGHQFNYARNKIAGDDDAGDNGGDDDDDDDDDNDDDDDDDDDDNDDDDDDLAKTRKLDLLPENSCNSLETSMQCYIVTYLQMLMQCGKNNPENASFTLKYLVKTMYKTNTYNASDSSILW